MRALLLAGLALIGAGQATEDVWQITLKDGTIVWNLRLDTLRRDTIVFHQDKKTLRYPLLRVDEMRLVRAGTREVGAVTDAARYDGAANGTSDVVYQLTLLDLSERRRVVEQILRTRTAPPQK
jgi:hypothetical protein